MKKTINKWDVTTPKQEKIGKIIKITMAILFLLVWTPAFVHTIMQIIKLIVS